MRPQAVPTLLAALVVSLLAHVLMFASAGTFWTGFPTEIEFPLEASLVLPPPAAATPEPEPAPQPVAQPSAPKPTPAVKAAKPRPVQPAPAPVLPATAPESTPALADMPEQPAIATEQSLAEAETPPNTEASAQESKAPQATAPEPEAREEAHEENHKEARERPLRKPVRPLPDQARIRYTVYMGTDGFAVGEAQYIWHQQNGRYSLVSSVEATGLTALFISGRIVQVSEGRIDAEHGLRPEQYLLRKSERREDTARFYWPQKRLEHGNNRGIFDLPAQSQDLLSFPFQLAMTAQEGEPPFLLNVTNGRKFKEYSVHILGRESVKLGEKRLDTLHLQGRHEKDGTLDVWLDTARSGLPVKIRTLDQKGRTMMLIAEALEVSG
jgi:hypothetical protein